MKLTLGVTGNIGSGKSLVAELLSEKGCALVDADRVAHALYASDPALVQELARQFGEDILKSSGALDRERLGAHVFGDPLALETLNRIVHPHLLAALREQLVSSRRVMNRVVLDAALIVEWGLRPELSHLILVTAPEPLRLERLMARTGMPRAAAEARLRAQMPEEEKRAFADFVIENDGTEEELRGKVDAVWERIGSSG